MAIGNAKAITASVQPLADRPRKVESHWIVLIPVCCSDCLEFFIASKLSSLLLYQYV